MDRRLVFSFYGRDVSAGRTMRGVAGDTDRLRSRSLAAAKAVGVLAGGAAVAGLTSALRTGFREVSEYQGGLSQLKAGLQSTGNQASVTVKGMERLASRIEGYSGQTDDSIVKTEQLLLTFTKIRNEAGRGNKIFDRTTRIAADMAARMGGDASSAAIKLGKAMQDPVAGMTALTRVGVVFTDQQKAQNKALVEGGVVNALAAMGFIKTATEFNTVLRENNNNVRATVAQITGPLSNAQREMFRHYMEGGHAIEAQRNILKELNTEFAGSARSYGKTLPGQLDRMKRAYEGITQELATALLPSALRFTKWIRKDGIPALRDMGHWIGDHKTELEWFGGIFAGLAVSVKALRGVRSIQGLIGRGGVGAGGALGRAVSMTKPLPVFVTNPGGLPMSPGKGPTPIPAGKTPWWKKVAPVGKGFSLPLLEAYLATQGGDQAPRNPRIKGANARDTSIERALLTVLTALGQQIGTTGLPGDPRHPKGTFNVFSGGVDDPHGQSVNVSEATKYVLAYGTPAQVKSLKELGRTYPQVKAELKAYNDEMRGLNQLLVVNPGLAKNAADAHRLLTEGMKSAAAEAKIEAAMLGHDLGRGLVAGIEAEIPHATVAGKLLVSQTVKQMRYAADAHSPSRLTEKLGKDLADGLFIGFTNVRVWDKLSVDTRHGLMELSRDATRARDYQRDTRSNLLNYASLTGMGSQTGLFGAQTGGNTRAYLQGRVQRLRQFRDLREKLADKGASSALLAEYDAIGPDAVPEMRADLRTGRKGIDRLDRLEHRARHLAGAIASSATQSMYGEQIHNDLERLPDRIADRLAHRLENLSIITDRHKQDRKNGRHVRRH